MARFHAEAVRVPHLDIASAVTALTQGTRDIALQRALVLQPPTSLSALISLAQGHAECEEVLAACRGVRAGEEERKRPADRPTRTERPDQKRNRPEPRR